MGIPVLAGRAFTDRDTKDSTPVILISQSMARQMFSDGNPLGRRIRSWRDENLYREIVGVGGDVCYFGPDDGIRNVVYVPHTQDSWRTMLLTVRTRGEPQALVKTLQSEIWGLDNKLTVSEIRTMDEVVDTALARPRFITFLLSLFALTALALAAVGIYGLMSYSVTQRTREIGIRMALGGARWDVLRIVSRDALLLTAAGVAAGLAGAFALTRLISAILFGVSPTDAATFLGASAVLILVALLATYVPTRRASKVDPLVALRYE
jgi:putative ABC transport system permease protein